MAVNWRHSEALNGIAFEVEFDQDRRLVAHYPAVMPRFDRDHLGSLEFHHASVRVLDVNLPASQKPDVGVLAQIGSHERLYVRRPPESGRINDPLHPALSGAYGLNRDAPKLAALGSFYRF